MNLSFVSVCKILIFHASLFFLTVIFIFPTSAQMTENQLKIQIQQLGNSNTAKITKQRAELATYMLSIDPESYYALYVRSAARGLLGDKTGAIEDLLSMAKIHKQRGEEKLAKDLLLRVHRYKLEESSEAYFSPD